MDIGAMRRAEAAASVQDIVALRSALLVREHRGFRRASEVLGVNQSVLSRRVNALEQALGLPLFYRRSNGAHPTPDGELFLREVARALQMLQLAAVNAGAAARGEGGRLVLGHVRPVTGGTAQDLQRAFRACSPALELELREGGGAELVSAVLNQELDLLLIDAERAPRGLCTRTAWTETWVLALPLDAPGGPDAWREGRIGPILCCAGEDWPFIQRLLSERGGAPQGVRAQPTSHDAVLSLVAAGAGCAILPQSVVDARPAGVRTIPLPGGPATSEVCLAWRPDNENPALRRFLDVLAAGEGCATTRKAARLR